jgi:hypothetical protein
MVGMARCAVPVAERSVRRRKREAGPHVLARIPPSAPSAGILFVFFWASLALVDFFTRFDNALLRWLLASVFALYWPIFICATIQTKAEMEDGTNQIFTGIVGFLLVSAGCIYDHFFPHFVQQRIHGIDGDVPEYSGIKWAIGISLFFGFIMSIAEIQRFRSAKHSGTDRTMNS